jgi:hypothetical protein
MAICNSDHRYDPAFTDLPEEQGGAGRHKCAACAYDRGYEAGLHLINPISFDVNTLPQSQAGNVRHKSALAAFAKGYLDGITAYYNRSTHK